MSLNDIEEIVPEVIEHSYNTTHCIICAHHAGFTGLSVRCQKENNGSKIPHNNLAGKEEDNS